MKVKLGRRSKLNLSAGVDYRIVHVICEATRQHDFEVDWGVFESKRDLETQRRYVREGSSKTMNSKHIPDKDEVVGAVDIVPYVNGKYDWSEKYFHDIIKKIKETAQLLYPEVFEFGYDWGWDMPHIQVRTGKEI